jgi:hypothetical protein
MLNKIPMMSFTANILAERAAAERGLIAPCIYTTGYAGQDVALLPDLLYFLDADLIDIRFAPTGDRQIQWRKDYLRLLLKDRYRHIPHLGNRFLKDSNQLSIQNLALGIKIITQMGANLLLMCECRKVEDCHRAIISQYLKKQGFETQEITDWRSRK